MGSTRSVARDTGSQRAAAILAWRLLKPGGLLIVDDYLWRGGKEGRQPKDRPGPDLVAFYTFYGRHFDVVHAGYQLFLRKKTEGVSGEGQTQRLTEQRSFGP